MLERVLLTRKEVCELLGISNTTFFVLKEQGKFKPIKLHDNAVSKYLREDIEELIKNGYGKQA